MRKSELDLTNLKKWFKSLSECYQDYVNQSDIKIKSYIKDSCIKRFEYTYETAKKIMNKFLKKEYDKLLINDLEEPSFKLNEELKHIKESLLEYGNVVMSGSGSTMLILTDDSDCITKIKDKYPTYLIKET